MVKSSLATVDILSPNYDDRTEKIDTITIHHMAGDISVETCGSIFSNPRRNASSNYGIDSTGKIACYVPEDKRSWCSGNAANDQRAITIEVANNSGAPDWTVSDQALESLVNLCVDICKRNGIPRLLWQNDPSLIGQTDRQNMTVHQWFQSTSCPGPYLLARMGEIASMVNLKLDEGILYRVQIGAYAVKENAERQLEKAKRAGFTDAFITTAAPNFTPKAPEQPSIVVGSTVKIRQNAKTYDGVELADYVYDDTYNVIEISGDRAVIAKGDVVMAAMRTEDLYLA